MVISRKGSFSYTLEYRVFTNCCQLPTTYKTKKKNMCVLGFSTDPNVLIDEKGMHPKIYFQNRSMFLLTRF